MSRIFLKNFEFSVGSILSVLCGNYSSHGNGFPGSTCSFK